jgi:hypothetical protein
MNLTIVDALIAVLVTGVAVVALFWILRQVKVPDDTSMTIVAGIVGIGLLGAFVGFLLWWVKAVPLIVIIALSMALLLYDWITTIRFGEKGASS